MKVLLLTQVLPYPPDSGPKVKTWNVLKYLVQKHDVTLVSFVRGDQSKDIQHLQKYCQAVHTVQMKRHPLLDMWYMARSFITNEPFMMERDDRADMRRLIELLTQGTQFDVAHADQLNMGQYALRVTGARTILDLHNALWVLYKRLADTMPFGPKKILLNRDWQLLKRYEGKMCNDFDAVLAVSHEDKLALEEAMGHASDMPVIPIAVDTDEDSAIDRHENADHIFHIGTMYWPPNIDGILWFINEIYPLIRAARPDVVFDVVGSRPPESITRLHGTDGINITGYVEDPTMYYKQTGVMIVPLRAGGGMRVKILNALSQALPMVSTTLGAEGINVTHGDNILIADEPQDFANAVLRLLEDKTYAHELGTNGRKLMQQQYDYRVVCTPLDEIYMRRTGF